MDNFLIWWHQSSKGLSLIWAEHIAFLLVGTAFIWFFWHLIFNRLFSISEKTHLTWDSIFLESIKSPINTLLLLGPSLYIIDSILKATETLDNDWFTISLRILFFIIFLWILFRLVNGTEACLMESTKHDQTTVSAIGHVLRLLLAFIGTLFALHELGISLTGVLTVGGVGGLIIGLAAKDLLSNFFGGLMIYFDRPFSVGDWISSPDRSIQGTVERIGLRMTMIRKFDSSPLYVPNSVFSSIVVENPSRMRHRRIFETFGLRYKDAEKIDIIVSKVKYMLENHPDIDQRSSLMVNFDSVASSSLNFFIYTFTKTVNWSKYNDVKQDVMLKVIAIVHGEDADFAFPTRTIDFDSEPPPQEDITSNNEPAQDINKN